MISPVGDQNAFLKNVKRVNDDYELRKKLSRGAKGVIYRAGILSAIKIINETIFRLKLQMRYYGASVLGLEYLGGPCNKAGLMQTSYLKYIRYILFSYIIFIVVLATFGKGFSATVSLIIALSAMFIGIFYILFKFKKVFITRQ